MAQLAVAAPVQGVTLKKARLRIQKPEISTYRPPVQAAEQVTVGFGWKLMVALTYLFSFITFYFALTV